MSLFNTGFYKLHSGEFSNFKIDADALTDSDINSIATKLVEILPNFVAVEGVPTGGTRLAAALRRYAVPNPIERKGWYHETAFPLLIVDDVFTTGGSMEDHRAGRYEAIGAVIFARGVVPSWITPLFQMSS